MRARVALPLAGVLILVALLLAGLAHQVAAWDEVSAATMCVSSRRLLPRGCGRLRPGLAPGWPATCSGSTTTRGSARPSGSTFAGISPPRPSPRRSHGSPLVAPHRSCSSR